LFSFVLTRGQMLLARVAPGCATLNGWVEMLLYVFGPARVQSGIVRSLRIPQADCGFLKAFVHGNHPLGLRAPLVFLLPDRREVYVNPTTALLVQVHSGADNGIITCKALDPSNGGVKNLDVA